ncbi:hypothetical protein [Bradyrhizobium sp. LMTR 3]|uniref:hypothetical protein n=1 Tax=Bradyrhizobium sp. LMTR 3 TaxID=189873 RepID=UPI00159F3318|nr:hypothetical protein [Bradyrhizobium sp. LMTR 3]
MNLAVSQPVARDCLTACRRGSNLKRKKKNKRHHREDHDMLRRASTMLAAVTLGFVTALTGPVQAQTTEKPLVLKGQSTHPASSNFHLIFKLWAETVEKMTAGRLKIETLPAGAIVPPFEVFDATSKNVLDVGMGRSATSSAATPRRFRCRMVRCTAWTARTTGPGTMTAAA